MNAEFAMQDNLRKLSDDYARAKAAQKELEQMKKVVWILLRQIGEPVTIDKTSLVGVPDDADIYEQIDSRSGFVTLSAR